MQVIVRAREESKSSGGTTIRLHRGKVEIHVTRPSDGRALEALLELEDEEVGGGQRGGRRRVVARKAFVTLEADDLLRLCNEVTQALLKGTRRGPS